jgi:hypothetical protein
MCGQTAEGRKKRIVCRVGVSVRRERKFMRRWKEM